MAKIAVEAIPKLKDIIDNLTSDPDGAPGAVFAAVNKNGDEIFTHASGTVGVGKSDPMTMNSVFWMASCTKVITGIAALQLVEQGKLSLDDSDLVERLAPEMKAVQVLENDQLVPKVRSITLRMLLTHTAGFGYAFFNERLNTWAGPVGLEEFSGSYHDYLSQPLVNQPGERWEYGISMDWAGQLVERASGQKLNDYFLQHIFAPLNITQINMFPTDEMKANLVYQNYRAPNGKLSLRLDGHLNRRPLYAKTQAELDSTFHQGGAGLFAQPTEYMQIIVTLLNDGVHPKVGNRILRKETVDQMFTNQIPNFPNFARQGMHSCKPQIANSSPAIYPEPHDIPQGWGLTFFLHLRESFVHSEGTAWWGGLPNLFWWIDRRRGVCGILASQILPFGDKRILALWAQIEKGINENLQQIS
ncbi:beta-lactamase [Dactylonectria estremocensis]|uniref:Beta-lactamase n=1 Tax=Dactylonectria estremocensis TaxID=1079267 RepID=A0A9P9J087_9HYPO|nr:beta-lactamase [Dactylonectria estremocensis]